MRSFFILLLFVVGFASPAMAADGLWPDGLALTLSEGEECGRVSVAAGVPGVRRSFMDAKEPELPLEVSDRVYAGDEIIVPANGRLEVLCGRNTIVTAAPGAKFRLAGVRAPGRDRRGVQLAVLLREGAIRAEVRLNAADPETLAVRSGAADLFLERGDMAISGGRNWRISVLDGSAVCRLRRGGAAVPSYVLAAGESLSPEGKAELGNDATADLREALAFSFEERRAALPPVPPPDPLADAP